MTEEGESPERNGGSGRDAMPEGLRSESDAGEGADGGAGDRFESDADRRELLREVAEDVYGESSESRQLSAVLYRVSDLYDPAEDTSPEEIYLNVRHIMDIKERGGLRTE
ncbi:hypothetical protein C474_01147 [Halogeometricum pallidum JCM 14848]|uniref:Uncharacterized protein n=1 Tax=Halogeometricum pallidum JCM 14848 TaxID=1227487 RepID=M0DL92_HALPD|nr:hypothetical protein [Halogeometricum pallidum]ELZ34924.1 hypothetical protein C474_01147 [Halogeometricum pallidum JCM 14848]